MGRVKFICAKPLTDTVHVYPHRDPGRRQTAVHHIRTSWIWTSAETSPAAEVLFPMLHFFYINSSEKNRDAPVWKAYQAGYLTR